MRWLFRMTVHKMRLQRCPLWSSNRTSNALSGLQWQRETSRRVTTGFHITCHARGGIRISFHTSGIQQSGHTSKIAKTSLAYEGSGNSNAKFLSVNLGCLQSPLIATHFCPLAGDE